MGRTVVDLENALSGKHLVHSDSGHPLHSGSLSWKGYCSYSVHPPDCLDCCYVVRESWNRHWDARWYPCPKCWK